MKFRSTNVSVVVDICVVSNVVVGSVVVSKVVYCVVDSIGLKAEGLGTGSFALLEL